MANHLSNFALVLIWSFLPTLAGCGSSGDSQADAGNNDGDAASPSSTNASEGCSRELLKTAVTDYFDALSSHDPSQLPLASKVKFTENGVKTKVGEGFWTTAGELKFKRSALDTETCNTVTESVISEAGTDIVFGLRLKLVASKIEEIETIVVRSGDYISSPSGLLGTSDDDWESVLSKSARPTREELAAVVDNYFLEFPEGVCGFPDDCTRYENGLATGACAIMQACADAGVDMGSRSMTPRLYVLDAEAGIAVGFTMFTGRTIPGTYSDFHMFKYRDGNVHGIHATLATASQSGWD